MKKYTSFLLPFILLIVYSCDDKETSMSGNWVTEMDDQPQHKTGFTLTDSGLATAINDKETGYERWEKQGDKLLLFGKLQSDKQSVGFTDTLKIMEASDSTLLVRDSRGEKIRYKKVKNVDSLISKFETFECFAYYTKKDTAFLHLNIADGLASGSLEYHLFEKDSNDGRVNGKVQGDTLIADYTFFSEGVESVRQIIFLKSGNHWLEGFGNTTEKSGKLIFENRAKVNFKNGLLFKQIECP